MARLIEDLRHMILVPVSGNKNAFMRPDSIVSLEEQGNDSTRVTLVDGGFLLVQENIEDFARRADEFIRRDRAAS